MLTQRSEYMGDQYVYVSKSGFKWVNPKAGANLVTASPDWVVTMFNDKTSHTNVTRFDKLILNMLYDRRIRNGQTAAAVQPVLPQVLKDAKRRVR